MNKKMTTKQFAILLSTINLSSFMECKSLTEVEALKKSRIDGEPTPFSKIENIRQLNIQLNYDLDGQVNRRAEKEGIESDFQKQEHKWARRVKGSLARHKDYIWDGADFDAVDLTKLYIPYNIIRYDAQFYLVDGRIETSLKPYEEYLPKPSNYKNQPQEDKVIIQYMKLKSVKEITYKGETYDIVD